MIVTTTNGTGETNMTTATKASTNLGYANEGCIQQDGPLPIKACHHCGRHIVRATSKRTGNRYPVNVVRGNRDQALYMKSDIHKCDPDEVQVYTAALAACLADGRMIKGQTVEVIKGRKYPVGATGTVFWIADEPDQWGVVKVGVMSDAGEKMWLNIDNVKAAG